MPCKRNPPKMPIEHMSNINHFGHEATEKQNRWASSQGGEGNRVIVKSENFFWSKQIEKNQLIFVLIFKKLINNTQKKEKQLFVRKIFLSILITIKIVNKCP